jgi:uncharacterized protein YneR
MTTNKFDKTTGEQIKVKLNDVLLIEGVADPADATKWDVTVDVSEDVYSETNNAIYLVAGFPVTFAPVVTPTPDPTPDGDTVALKDIFKDTDEITIISDQNTQGDVEGLVSEKLKDNYRDFFKVADDSVIEWTPVDSNSNVGSFVINLTADMSYSESITIKTGKITFKVSEANFTPPVKGSSLSDIFLGFAKMTFEAGEDTSLDGVVSKLTELIKESKDYKQYYKILQRTELSKKIGKDDKGSYLTISVIKDFEFIDENNQSKQLKTKNDDGSDNKISLRIEIIEVKNPSKWFPNYTGGSGAGADGFSGGFSLEGAKNVTLRKKVGYVTNFYSEYMGPQFNGYQNLNVDLNGNEDKISFDDSDNKFTFTLSDNVQYGEAIIIKFTAKVPNITLEDGSTKAVAELGETFILTITVDIK